jgi:hypothetical protein
MRGAARQVNAERTKLLRSARHKYTRSWFAPREHALAGVAVFKDFETHSFTLIAKGGPGQRGELSFDVAVPA